MKIKILTTVLALVIICSVSFAGSKTTHHEKRSSSKIIEMPTDSVYYTCSMHKDVRMDKTGKCPTCEMPLARKIMKIYTCPVHPEVKSERAGKCPKCGMPLEKRAMKMAVIKSEKSKH